MKKTTMYLGLALLGLFALGSRKKKPGEGDGAVPANPDDEFLDEGAPKPGPPSETEPGPLPKKGTRGGVEVETDTKKKKGLLSKKTDPATAKEKAARKKALAAMDSSLKSGTDIKVAADKGVTVYNQESPEPDSEFRSLMTQLMLFEGLRMDLTMAEIERILHRAAQDLSDQKAAVAETDRAIKKADESPEAATRITELRVLRERQVVELNLATQEVAEWVTVQNNRKRAEEINKKLRQMAQ